MPPAADTLRIVTATVDLCPHCVEPSDEPIFCNRCGWRWYANPKPASGALIERATEGGEPSVLLLRRAVDPGRGGWDLPAGYLEAHESFEHAALREAREESGLPVELVSLAGVYHSPFMNAVTAVFRARSSDPNASVAPDDESDDHAWVPLSAVDDWLPRMAFPSMAAALGDWASARRRDLEGA
jgi:ADP-ribose pyrophosphatase YjhB (NUDIX family)